MGSKTAWFVGGLLVFLHLFLTARANRDFSKSAFLEMDERISFSSVKGIFEAPNLRAAVLGTDPRYGGIFFHVSAIASALPIQIFGEPGQIIATRMAQSIILLLSYLILCACLTSAWLRVVLLAVLICLPHTPYYSTLPKPEPIQCLCLSLFLWFYTRRELRWGMHWIFMGLAFGAKISTLPLILLFGLATLWTQWCEFKKIQYFGILQSMLTCVTGFLIAVPSVAFGLITGEKGYLQQYLAWTFRNTGHGSDVLTLSAIDWARYFVFDWSSVPWPIVVLVGIAIIVSGIVLSKEKHNRSHFAMMVVMSGVIVNALIFFQVKRLWGMYLHVGAILTCFGLLLLCDSQKKFQWALVIPLALLTFTLFRIQPTVRTYEKLATRSQAPDHLQNIRDYDFLIKLLSQSSRSYPGKLRVFWDPSLYSPDATAPFETLHFWSRIMPSVYESGYEFIVANRVRFLPPPEGEKSLDYEAFKESQNAQADYVSEKTCRKSPCYHFVETKLERWVVLARSGVPIPQSGM